MLIVAGSRGKTGAAVLAAQGALRSGAGLVTVATPRCCQPIVAAQAPEYMTEALDETVDGTDRFRRRRLRRSALSADVMAVGPGLGRGEGGHDVRARAAREERDAARVSTPMR